MELKNVVIVDFARSPISKAKDGALNAVTPLDISAQVVRQLLARNAKVPQQDIEMLVAGCAFPEAEAGFNIGRCLVIKAGLPVSVAGITVNQFCASSQQALMIVADALSCGKGEIGIVVGLEHMTRIPMGGFNPFFDPELKEKNFYMSMGLTAENLAKELGISREDQEKFAADSHRKALAAWESGTFAREVVPIDLPKGGKCMRDECPRAPEVDKMKSLPLAFDAHGTITAATASPVSTGTAAMLVMTQDKAKSLGIEPRARILSTAVTGCDYTHMGMGPLPASKKALERARLTLHQMDVIELNEAFAAQSLYVIRQGGFPPDKVNILGGAIALGHPLGMSGVRIVGTAITALEKVNGNHALATLCVGGGQGAATVLARK
jgi:acetyl-CoA acyltransferase